MTVQEKLLHIQQNLKAPKGQYNSFGNFHYRSCEDIQEAVKPLLKEVKALLLVGDEIIQIGSRFYIKATATFQDTESAESVTNTAFARESESKTGMDAAQITGSCSSYARKYALNGLFCIDDARDPDTQEPKEQQDRKITPAQQRKPAGQQVTKEHLDHLIREAERTGTDLSKVCARYQVKTIKDLTPEQYQRAMSAFKKMPTLPPQVPEGQQYGFDFNEQDMPFR